MNSNVTLDLTQLRLLKAEMRKARGARVHVGIMGDKAERVNTKGASGKNNPTIGMEHEFGIKGGDATRPQLPQRSFLRMPLMTRLGNEVDKIGKVVLRQIIINHKMRGGLSQLGELALVVIRQAFATEGWGQWPKLSPYTVAKKGSTKILIDHGEMRQAISLKVVIKP